MYENGVTVTHFQCLHCYRVFTSPYLMSEHLRITADDQLTCVLFCSDGAKIRKQTLGFVLGDILHQNVHLCSKCGRTFEKPSLLDKHVCKYDDAVRKFHCEVCSATFNCKNNLQTHVRCRHSSPQNNVHVCHKCGKEYFTCKALKYHLDITHGRERVPCPLCQKEISSKYRLKRHMKVHSKAYTYQQCPHCPQQFTTAYNLKVHLRIHSGEKPYKCQMCDVAFAQRNSLIWHMKKHGLEIRQPRNQEES